jgi:hypothetical protein
VHNLTGKTRELRSASSAAGVPGEDRRFPFSGNIVELINDVKVIAPAAIESAVSSSLSAIFFEYMG